MPHLSPTPLHPGLSAGEARRVANEYRTEQLEQRLTRMVQEEGMTRRDAILRLAAERGLRDPSSLYRKLKRHREGKRG